MIGISLASFGFSVAVVEGIIIGAWSLAYRRTAGTFQHIHIHIHIIRVYYVWLLGLIVNTYFRSWLNSNPRYKGNNFQ